MGEGESLISTLKVLPRGDLGGSKKESKFRLAISFTPPTSAKGQTQPPGGREKPGNPGFKYLQ